MNPDLPYVATGGVTPAFIIPIVAIGLLIGFFAWIAIALGGYSPSTVLERRIKGAAVGVVALLLWGGGTAMVISDADNFPQIRDVEDFHSWADGRYLEDFTDADAQRIADMIGARSTKPVITEDGTAVGYLHDAGSGRLILTGASGDELTREAR